MPDSGDQLLLKFGLDLGPVRQASEAIRQILSSLNSLADQVKSNAAQATGAQSAQMSALKDAASAATQAALEGISAEKLRGDTIKQQTAELQKQATAQRAGAQSAKESLDASRAKRAAIQAETADLQKTIAQRRAETAEITRQTAELRKKRMEEAAARKESGGEEGGIKPGALFGRVLSGLSGKGLVGTITGGVLAGEGIAGGISLALESLEHLVERLKDVSIESGSIAKLDETFRLLATQGGNQADEMLQNLEKSTDGLVTRMTLLKTATMALRSPYHINAQMVQQLSHDVVVLSEASGKTAEQGMQALSQALAIGRPYLLSAATGAAGLRDAMRDLPSAVDPATRSTMEWARVIQFLHKEAENIGELPPSLENMTTRLKVAVQNIALAFGTGLNEKFGTSSFAQDTDKLAEAFVALEKEANKLGQDVARVLSVAGEGAVFLANHMQAVLNVLRLIGAAIMADAVFKLGTVFVSLALKVNTAREAILAWVAAQKVASVSTTVDDFGEMTVAVENATVATRAATIATRGFGAALTALGTTNIVLIGLTAVFALLSKLSSNLSDQVERQTNLVPTLSDKWLGLWKTMRENPIGLFFGDPFQDVGQEMERNVAARTLARAHMRKVNSEISDSSSLTGPEGLDAWGRKTFGEAWDPDATPDPQLIARNARAVLATLKAAAQERLTIKKQEITAEQELDSERYSTGEETLKTHLANMRKIALETRNNEIAKARADLAAKKKDISVEVGAGMLTPTEGREQLKQAVITEHTAAVAAETTYQTALTKADMQGIQDRRQAALTEARMQSQIRMQSIREQETLSHEHLQTGNISPEEFTTQRMDQIKESAEAQIKLANQTYQLSLKSQHDLETRTQSLQKAISDASNSLDTLIAKLPEEQLQAVEHRFQPQQAALQAQLQSMNQAQSLGGVVPLDATQKEMQQNLANQMHEYVALLKTMTDEGQQYSDVWWQTYQRMQQTYEMQVKINKEVQGGTTPAAQILDSLNQITSLWTSKFAQNFASVISMGTKALSKTQQRLAIVTGAENVPKSPEQLAFENEAANTQAVLGSVRTSAGSLGSSFGELTSTVNQLISYLKGLVTPHSAAASAAFHGPQSTVTVHGNVPPLGLEPQENQLTDIVPYAQPAAGPDFSDRMSAFAAKLNAAVSSLTDFIGAITHSKTAIAGAFGGGMAGFGAGRVLGGAAQSATENMGGALGTIGGMMGKYGGVAGAGIGMMMGAITGAKNGAIANEVSSLNATYSSIMQSFQQNTNNLNATIVQMKALIEQASEEEANSKKGGSQFASLVTQYNQELDSLTNQQSSMISQMETQLAIFDTPSGMQSFLTNLNDIIQQYDKFSGAADNVSQLAAANEWLTDSLSNFTQTLTHNFASDQESAINDALSLNELLSARSTLMTNLNNQIQSVLEQGVLTRQQTSAQRKGQQIETLESNASNELSSIDQQISLEQYKVSVEQYIFNLATTKIGLETQLLALQENQSSQQLAAIQALQTLINALQNGNYNFSTIQSILSALGYGGAASSIPIPPGSNPVAAGQRSGANMDDTASAAYASRGALGYGSYRGTNL